MGEILHMMAQIFHLDVLYLNHQNCILGINEVHFTHGTCRYSADHIMKFTLVLHGDRSHRNNGFEYHILNFV